jgi:hypothetical protein
MKDALAERLLAHVMQWGPQQVAQERPYLQAMAAYKYDEYQQFSPGMRFVESLARWLAQFGTNDERQQAYEFVKTKLVYLCAAEVNHLVECAYPDIVRPLLLRMAAPLVGPGGGNVRHVTRTAASVEFQALRRQSLFLGLSDGSRIDHFRRANPELNQEQIWQTHEIAEPRVGDMLESLAKDVGIIRGAAPAPCKFRTVVLLDDFSASGSSYYSFDKNSKGEYGGKIAKFHRGLTTPGDPLADLVDARDVQIIVLLYIATEDALTYLRRRSAEFWGGSGIPFTVEAVQTIPKSIQVVKDASNPLAGLIETYYDRSVFTRHFAKGGTIDAKYGYAACGLPVVLHHNTPNNSIALLWSYEDRTVRGLFPRVTRHKEMP